MTATMAALETVQIITSTSEYVEDSQLIGQQEGMQVSFLKMLLDVFSVDDQSGSLVVVGEPQTVATGTDELVEEPTGEAVVGEPQTVATGTDELVEEPTGEAVVGEPQTVATGKDELVEEPTGEAVVE